MRKLLLVLCFLLVGKFSSFASHIVGGEFELIHLNGNTYRLNLIIYFDEINGNPGAKFVPEPIAWIYRKSDNAAFRSVNLPFRSEEKVLYTIPDCTNDNIVNTTRMVFSSVITLDPETYSDEGGYYISWQRCCRNYTIQNIISQDPNLGGEGAGQTFLLEIPPLIKNGERFINSSPRLFPPLSDYACVNRKFYADFQGSDDDGDSLVYSISEPLNTPSAVPHPQPPSTAPYPIVKWIRNFSIDNIVNGAPDLEISKDGFLTVTPTLPGIFVFAVKCEEFRDGEKIGEVRRDFQMVIVDCPDPGEKPVVEIEKADGSIYKEGEVLRFRADDSKCVKFSVEDKKGGRVNLKLDPVNFDEENFTIKILSRSPAGDKLNAEVCFTDCPPTRDLPFQVDFIGLDATCPQPLQDTVRLTMAITPPDNDLPVINHKEDISPAFSQTTFRNVVVNEMAGGRKIVELLGIDGNKDNMEFTIEPMGFELVDVGMSITDRIDSAGRIEKALEWNFDCQQFSFDTPQAFLEGKSDYTLFITLEDLDDCLYEDPQLFELKMTIILPDNTRPDVFSTDLGSKSLDYFKREPVLESVIGFDVFAEDLDGDSVYLNAVGANFDLATFGAVFPAVGGKGGAGNTTSLNSRFSWPLLCDNFNLAEQDSFRVYFFVEDFDKCEITNQDTLTVDFVIRPTVNSTPILRANALNDLEIVEDTIKIMVNQLVQISLTGTDFEGDSIFIDILSDEGIMGYVFERGVGIGQANATFTWTPGCEVFTNSDFNETFDLIFVVRDDNCSDPLANQLLVTIQVEDVLDDGEFLPPNVFTPNGDDSNEFFGMYQIDKETLEIINILPVDNCAGVFEGVSIFNRWGKEIYFSSDREFRWFGEGVPAGIYFYSIKFTNRDFRGSVTVLY